LCILRLGLQPRSKALDDFLDLTFVRSVSRAGRSCAVAVIEERARRADREIQHRGKKRHG
jgi:hypothetical protein